MSNWKVEVTEPERLFFDLETLDTANNAVVLSVGITPFKITEQNTFEELVDRGFEMLFDVDKQIERGATVSDDTLKWWSEQSGRAQEVLNGGTNDPQDFLDACKTDFPDINLNKALWYCHGTHFDIAIMQNLFERYSMKAPWHYQSPRDARTWMDFFGGIKWPEKPKGFIPHNALHDSAFEVTAMQHMWHTRMNSASDG